nr:MAG TPA: hypothetical protein [Caudoviricetes sp.]
MKARIFLTITDILKIVDYTGLSMRLPPKAANPKPLCCFSIDGKRKRRLFNRHLEKGIL